MKADYLEVLQEENMVNNGETAHQTIITNMFYVGSDATFCF